MRFETTMVAAETRSRESLKRDRPLGES